MPVWKFKREAENRTFKDSVEIKLDHLDAFPKDYEAFINDNFSFRTPLLNLYHHIKYYCWGISSHPDKTIMGKDGWFFVAGKEKDSYEGKIDFSPEQLKEFECEWTNRKSYLDSMHIKAYWVVCPMKYNVYPEKLPFNLRNNHISRRQQLLDYLKGKFSDVIVNPLSALLKAKDTMKVYYKLDDHWNTRGGYVISQVLLNRIKNDFPQLHVKSFVDYQWKDSIFNTGFHYKVLGIKSRTEDDKYPVVKNEFSLETAKYGFPPISDFPYPWDYERRFVNNKDTVGPKILIIRDSFGDQVLPFVKESFRESVFIFDSWRYGLNKNIIEKYRPDIVVFLGLETHLEHMIIKYD
jgi:hypothetical protein